MTKSMIRRMCENLTIEELNELRGIANRLALLAGSENESDIMQWGIRRTMEKCYPEIAKEVYDK